MSNESPNKFEDFLLNEYSNIAQAHFKSIETISTFFRYYLLIMSIPVTVVVAISQFASNGKQLVDIVNENVYLIFGILLCISLIGTGVLCYIINLRLDVILYARVVNGVRKFFYDKYGEDLNLKSRWRALPQSPQLPHYFEKSYFFPVVFVFGVMNTLYFSLASYIFVFFILEKFQVFVVIAVSSVFFLLHFAIYFLYAIHREYEYLRSNIFGIDIDGVLNKHRDHFCRILEKKTSKTISPEQIAVMPIHEDESINISREDERSVFNTSEYWSDMPNIEEASPIIKKLCNELNMRIFIFTYRSWPDADDETKLSKYKNEFWGSCKDFSVKERLKNCVCNTEPIEQITKEWLKKHKIPFNKILFEKGNDYSSDTRSKTINRFNYARKYKIRYFVEDDIEKAIKLSFICDVVFLITHPYNEENDKLSEEENRLRKKIPSNIVRVNGWSEIYKHVRRIS